MKYLSVLFLIFAHALFAEGAPVTEQQFSFRIKTGNTDSVFQKIIREVEAGGGYFTNYDKNSLSLRIPVAALPAFQTFLGSLAEIEEKGFESYNRNAEIERLNIQIASAQKLLDSYFQLVQKASFGELQSAEREMVTLNARIDGFRGRLQAIQKRAQLALVRIDAAYRPPVRPAVNYYSPFPWIQATDLRSLTESFLQEENR
ncbi:MAG: DUF4349 domain-containing protein [Fibrobacter sp.]|jgi:hypothetical protein|nr:DUF4349 domain-containing protein [Fibrobacter sp.]